MNKKILLIYFVTLFSFLSAQDLINFDLKDPGRPIISVTVDPSFTGPVNFEKGSKILRIGMLNEGKVSEVPLLGDYTIQNSVLSFTPMYTLGKGLEFEAQFYLLKDTVKKRFKTPSAVTPNKALPQVKNIFPRIDKIPANILLFYVEFSEPMTDEVLAWTKVKIIDAVGKEKEMPWRNKASWVNGNILVLMIHPAYVKRGIESFKEKGELFTVGTTYSLVVTKNIKDEYGRDLEKEYYKKFTITADDRKIPEIDYKGIKIPKVNTKEALVIPFNEEMDYGSILYGIKCFTTKNLSVNGKMEYTNSDKTWKFVPEEAWKDQQYEIQFDKNVADPASNHLHRLFEIKNLTELNDEGMPKKWTFTPKKR